ncbi:MAG: hypothetical protein GF353_21590 [Candidatus Lokiarchaeota archaeon]|nr:hypothetical protein [Candidatus Lokiarchaeota archaeon]
MIYNIISNTEFSSKWKVYNAGWDYRKIKISDPLLRIEMINKLNLELHKQFPEVYKKKKRKIQVNLGEFGVTTMPRLFGCEIKYSREVEPWGLPIIPEKLEPMKLKVPNIEDGLLWLAEEYDKIRDAYGRKIQVLIPDMQGPMNIAYKLCGDRFFQFIGIKSKKEIGHHIMQVVTETYIQAYQWIKKLLKQKPQKTFIVSECTSYFVSPQLFEEFNLKYDIKAAKQLGPIFVHSCGLTENRKIELFTKLPGLMGAELGYGSDLKYARRTLILKTNKEEKPLLIIARIDPRDMFNLSDKEIKERINKLICQAADGPLMISVLGIPYKTPKENVITFHKTCEEYNDKIRTDLSQKSFKRGSKV